MIERERERERDNREGKGVYMRTTGLRIHMATTGKQQDKLQVYENNFVRRIARKLVRSRLKWTEWKGNG